MCGLGNRGEDRAMPFAHKGRFLEDTEGVRESHFCFVAWNTDATDKVWERALIRGLSPEGVPNSDCETCAQQYQLAKLAQHYQLAKLALVLWTPNLMAHNVIALRSVIRV